MTRAVQTPVAAARESKMKLFRMKLTLYEINQPFMISWVAGMLNFDKPVN